VGVVVNALQVTVEALTFSLRERGTKALEESSTKRRFANSMISRSSSQHQHAFQQLCQLHGFSS